MSISGFQRPPLLIFLVRCSRACHLWPQSQIRSRIGKPEVLIKPQKTAQNAAKRHCNVKQHAKSRNGLTKLELEVVSTAVLDL